MKLFGYYLMKADVVEKMAADLDRETYLHQRGLAVKEALENELNQLRGDLAWKGANAMLTTELGYLRARIGEVHSAIHNMEIPIDEVLAMIDALADEAGYR